MSVTIYHNPRCSKSRQTLQLLEQRGIEAEIVEYLITPPSVQKLEQILALLGLSARELMRRKEPVYRELGLENEHLTEAELIAAMRENPVLIERPIVVANAEARIGRPPERILEIL